MASVTSLDQDMRNLRMSRYTPQAAKEARTWIEESLGEQLPPGDLLEVLKDGVALCKMVNMAIPPPGVKFKNSGMPFIQMENISHFLRACEMSPLNLPAHDRFLTVDLYEAKDPAQVLQCLGAFSRRAHALDPSRFRTTIGSKKPGGVISPTSTGTGTANGSGTWRSSTYGRPSNPVKPSSAMPSASRALSPSLTGGSNGSQSSTKSPGPTSSWSSRKDEGMTSPAWNIHQYGYMGGASQGNQGISFGARRQITSQSPNVPSLAEKERKRREKAEEDERLRQQAEEADHKRRMEREAQDEHDRVNEERRWDQETRRLRDEERRRVDEQKRQWEAQERKWKEEEEARRKEDADIQSKLAPKKPPERPRVSSSSILRGQTLAQYQKEQAALTQDNGGAAEEAPEQRRVREPEKQLEEARERERQYQAEREEKLRNGSRPSTARTETPRPQSARESEKSFANDERDYLRQRWQTSRDSTPPKPPVAAPGAQRPLPSEPPSLPSRALPQPEIVPEDEDEASQVASLPSQPTAIQQGDSTSSIPPFNPDSAPTSSPLGSSNRPLPTPGKQFEAYSPIQPRPPIQHYLPTSNTTQPKASPNPTPSTASKSLLEREMERERARQREWEADQEVLKTTPKDPNAGIGEGKSWDVNQYGYTGGDGMNKGSSSGSGIDFGGRRQILGPRPQR
ncbi:hypothetical protein LTR62_008423 [Meristemomyces frigidus]|uniref:Calponin-homology (CH) domain-containing protein n=1 Tax=Meristemomyces frigidus TaxID=1508187 RepID=A0AAN7TAL3_9PEZI|nr:hypothetical protein LTR62_008423 [Meristemomyces frigidus]